jgi:hypothetical protein
VFSGSLLVGCGPSVPDDELGRVMFELPEIPEGYEPYKLPDLTAPTAPEDADEPQSELPPS